MVWLILAMLIVLVLAAVVVGLVAVPARRQGREFLTPKGERVVDSVARGSGKVVSTAKQRTGSVASARSRTRSTTRGASSEVAESGAAPAAAGSAGREAS